MSTCCRLAACTVILLVAVAALPAAAGERTYNVLRWTEDWSWLGSGTSGRADPFDSVKHVELGGDWSFSLGGSFRVRAESDEDRTLGASAIDDETRILFRSFLHWEIDWNDRFRWFSEVRYSDAWSEDRPAGAIFRDDFDVQNFFLEATAAAGTTHPITFRIGRQELLFGAQRLVSPLNWSSTRRTFDGLTVTFETPRSETVLFGTAPVAHEIHDIDSPIEDQVFAGVHSVMKPAKGHRVEAYFYRQDDSRDLFMNEAGTKLGELERNTYGARYLFTRDGWKVDVEAALQDGEMSTDDVSAWMASGTLGYTWGQAAWKPALEAGFDIATGDEDPLDGESDTFNQLFPLGHAYFGHLDLVGRQNVEAVRLQLALKPAPRVKWVTSLHRFWLESRTDALYNAGGAATRRDPTGAAGDDVATELDVLVSWSFATHHSLAFELTRWWSNDFIENTGFRDDAWFAWLAYEFKF